MGTRCLTIVMDGDQEIATIYRHWDGYPSEAGADIKRWLLGRPVVNGYICGTDQEEKAINGMRRVAPLVISRLEQGGHDPNLLLPGTREVGEEYTYVLSLSPEKRPGDEDNVQGYLNLTVLSGPMTMFGFGGERCTNQIYHGLLDDFDPDFEEVEEDA